MGAIMSVGVASANSILLVTFAREQRQEGMNAFEAALSAGTTRLRPVLMTAAAMIVGMIPMAIGGAGEEQNAVLARAVIGGVLVGTITTLLFVPYLYSVFGAYERVAAHERKGEREDRGSAHGPRLQGMPVMNQISAPHAPMLRNTAARSPAQDERKGKQGGEHEKQPSGRG